MWHILIRIQKIIQKLCPLRVIYTDDNSGFSANPLAKKQFKMRLIDHNLCIVTIASIIGLRNVLNTKINSNQIDHSKDLTSEDIKIQTQKMVQGAVLFILYTTVFIILLVTTWSFKHKTNSAIFIINQARRLYLDRVRNPGKLLGGPTKRESALFGAFFYNLLIVCIVGHAAMTVFPLTSSNNPAHVILTWIFPLNWCVALPSLVKTFSCIYIGTSGYFGVIPVIQAFSYITAILYEAKYILKRAYNFDNGETSFKFYVKKYPLTFNRQWIIYAENILFVREFNQFGNSLFPGIMLTGFCINVVTTFICMKFYEELPASMFLLFLGFDAAVAVGTFVIHGFGAVAKEESERFRKYWKLRLFSKLAKRRVKACIPTAICIGPFFVLQKSTLLNTVYQVVNMVVTLLLADN